MYHKRIVPLWPKPSREELLARRAKQEADYLARLPEIKRQNEMLHEMNRKAQEERDAANAKLIAQRQTENIRRATEVIKWEDGFSVEYYGGTYTGFRDVGCANDLPRSWFAQFDGMKRYQVNAGRCLTRYLIPEAKVTYTIDSSD